MPEQALIDLLDDETLRSALGNWHGKHPDQTYFNALYLYRKLQREIDRPAHYVSNMLLLQAFDTLDEMYPEALTFLKKRYWDEMSVAELAQEYFTSDSTIYNRQTKALGLVRTSLIALEEKARREQYLLNERRLGMKSNDRVVGIDAHVQTLATQLRSPEVPWIVSIEGLGGIGKTTLARTVVDHLLDQQAFDEVGWVSAKQEYLEHGGAIQPIEKPALTADELIAALARQLLPELTYVVEQEPDVLTTALHTRLKRFPHLIVIDNLESVTDLEALLPTIQALANPSKFLLTSRNGLYTQPNLYHFTVPELSAADALTLLRQEIESSNLTALTNWSDGELQPIYEVVGGNPLALRLVVAQAHFYDVESILNHLRQATNRAAENLYTYIYLHAWERLTQLEQDLLLVMALVNPDGDTLATIAEFGELSETTAAEGLNALARLSLVEVCGDGHNRCYTIHGLTRTFLHEQVLRW
ncbi:MAG: hypothetical protein KDE19_03295 [Caldilineaceae bacterium]|nr:hypothetical protein [Caldilineaceae bacterium]